MPTSRKYATVGPQIVYAIVLLRSTNSGKTQVFIQTSGSLLFKYSTQWKEFKAILLSFHAAVSAKRDDIPQN